MKVNVKYFAAMREAAGKSGEVIETEAKTPDELYEELSQRYSFQLKKDHLKVAINEEYSAFTNELCEMDTIVFIPPVAGG